MVFANSPIHGGTDAGEPPRFDFSSNANALGPDPFVLSSIQSVDPAHYPDPSYTRLHRTLADYHRTRPEQVAVGAGASELILRLTRWRRTAGPVLTLVPTFGEYGRAARLAGLPLQEVQTTAQFLAALGPATLAFLCLPNNPTGTVYPQAFLEEVAHLSGQFGAVVIVDLAYLPLSEIDVAIPETLWRLYAPNKAHGMTGVRAGYLIAPENLQAFREEAPGWVLSVYGEEFLHSSLLAQSQNWVKDCCPTLWRWRDALACRLAALGLEQTWGRANFGLVQVGCAHRVTTHLRQQGIRVRDCTSFGLANWIRLSAQDEKAQSALIGALESLPL